MKDFLLLLETFVNLGLIHFSHQKSEKIDNPDNIDSFAFYDFTLTPANIIGFDDLLWGLLETHFPKEDQNSPIFFELSKNQIEFTLDPQSKKQLLLLTNSFSAVLEAYLELSTMPTSADIVDEEFIPDMDLEAEKLPPVKTILAIGQFGIAESIPQRDPTTPERLETNIRSALTNLIKLMEDRTIADTQGSSWLNPIARARDFGQGVKNISNSWSSKPVAINVKEQLRESAEKPYKMAGFDFSHEELETLIKILQNRQEHVQKPHRKEEHTEEITLLASTIQYIKELKGLKDFRRFIPH